MNYVETIKIDNGRVCNYNYHQARARETTGIVLPELIIPEQYRIGVMKCRVVYDRAISLVEFMPYTLPHIQSLKIVHASHYFYDRKSTHRNEINILFEQRGACDDILIAINGMITDTSFCNTVFVSDDGLFTPQAPLLKGTKRASLLERGIIRERCISVEDIDKYKYVKLINAMIDLEHEKTTISCDNILSNHYPSY